MKRILSSLIGCAAGLFATAAIAQDYAWKPDRPVTIIVPWAAGGSTDQMARIVATELEAEFKQKFIVVNQPGASGSIGTKNAVEAPPLLWILLVPRERLMPVVFVLCVVGSYAITSRVFGIYVMLFFGVVGFILRELKFPMAPLILGLVLGDLLEKNLTRGLVLSGGSLVPFFTRPVCAALSAITIISILRSIPPISRTVRSLLRRVPTTPA